LSSFWAHRAAEWAARAANYTTQMPCAAFPDISFCRSRTILPKIVSADYPKFGQISQYKGVCQYRSGETVNFPQADLIGIGAVVAHRPLPHHRAYGSVHGGSRWLR
jgi:hypothetical protein